MNNVDLTPDFNEQNKNKGNLGNSLKLGNYEVQKLSEFEFCYDIWIYQQRRLLEFKGIYRNGILNILIANGFRRMYRDKHPVYIREINNVIEEIKKPNVQDFVSSYVFEDASDLKFTLNGITITENRDKLKDAFLNTAHLIFNDTFLNNLPPYTKEQLKDNARNCFLFFKNGVFRIDGDSLKLIEYQNLQEKFVWKDHIINFEFYYTSDNDTAEYSKFIKNVSNQLEERIKGFKTGIGYLIHNYNDPAKGKAVICYDEVVTDAHKPMGGKGKGIFAKAIGQVRQMVKLDGKKFSSTDKFAFQEVSITTQIIHIDDVKTDFEFDRLNSALTDGLNIERKYEHAYTIKGDHAPKVIITSNVILDNEGTTRIRRQFVLEFSPHYSKYIKDGTEEPIILEHGSRFFSKEWDKSEWNKFYSYLIDAVQFFLNNGLIQPALISVQQNRLIQQTSFEFAEWIELKELEMNKQYLTVELFTEFKQLYYSDDEGFKQRKFSDWLKKYAGKHHLKIEFKTINGKNYFIVDKI